METYQITSAVLGFAFAGMIFWLVKRDHLHGRIALWWLSIAFVFAVLGLSPKLIDAVALQAGVNYPPILVVILGIGFLVIKTLIMDIERSKSLARLQRLAQRMAILEGRLDMEVDDEPPPPKNKAEESSTL